MSENPEAVLAAAMAKEAASFLASLSPAQRNVAQFEFPDNQERNQWFYTPTDHGGLTLGEMSSSQERAAYRLLASGLSHAGFVTATTIIGLENLLDLNEGWDHDFGRERGRDPGLYYVSVFGEPGDPAGWAWRFGGHHVSVHHAMLGGRVVSGTPSFFGANPATSKLIGAHFLRPLAGVQDTAVSLMAMLDPQQLAKAIVADSAPADIVTGNRSSVNVGDDALNPSRMPEIWRGQPEGATLAAFEQRQLSMEAGLGFTEANREALRFSATPIGLPVADFTVVQRDCLIELLGNYVHRLPDALADAEMQKISGERFDGLHLAWAGSTQAGEPMYYRVQGDGLVVEFDNTQGGANHIHAVWRDPQGDFGLGVLANHYAQSH